MTLTDSILFCLVGVVSTEKLAGIYKQYYFSIFVGWFVCFNNVGFLYANLTYNYKKHHNL